LQILQKHHEIFLNAPAQEETTSVSSIEETLETPETSPEESVISKEAQEAFDNAKAELAKIPLENYQEVMPIIYNNASNYFKKAHELGHPHANNELSILEQVYKMFGSPSDASIIEDEKQKTSDKQATTTCF
jgi:hypothetical protein